MKYIKDNKIIILIIVIIFGWFYWFQFRPSQIRKDCYIKIKGQTMTAQLGNLRYRTCLAEYGIKPENLTP